MVKGTDAARLLVDAIWGGAERPADDAGQLRAIADWMDRIDNIGDMLSGSDEKVGRSMQRDLRRIANRLDN